MEGEQVTKAKLLSDVRKSATHNENNKTDNENNKTHNEKNKTHNENNKNNKSKPTGSKFNQNQEKTANLQNNDQHLN